MCYAPVAEELLGGTGCKLRTPIRRQFLADAVCDENTAKASNETCSAICRLLNNCPVALPVNDDYVVLALEAEVVCSCALKWVDR